MKKYIIATLIGVMLPLSVFAQTMTWQGGTGTSTQPTLGQVLVGLSNGRYAPQATSTLGIIQYLLASINSWTAGQTFTISTTTSATTTNFSSTRSTLGNATSTTFAITSLNSKVLSTDAQGNVVATTSGGSGTVTSVGLSLPTGFDVSNSPVTGSGTLTGAYTSGYGPLLTASSTNYNTAFKKVNATFIVSSTTDTGDYTSIQTAINALPSGGGTIIVKCGDYTSFKINVSNTLILGYGPCTRVQGASGDIVGFNATGTTGVLLQDFYIHGTGTYAGIGINASNTPILYVKRIKMDNLATTTSIIDSANLSFYQHYEDLDLRDNTSCFDIGGNPVNDNTIYNVRCAPKSGNKGVGIFATSTSINGAQAWLVNHFEVEPTGAATSISCFILNAAVDWTLNNVYCEGNATAYSIGSGSQRVSFIGGEFITNTNYTISKYAQNINFFNVDKEGVVFNSQGAPTLFMDNSNNEASKDIVQIMNNTNWARGGNSLSISQLNGSDTGTALAIGNAGSGNTITATTTAAGSKLYFGINGLGVGTTTTFSTNTALEATTPASNATTTVIFGKSGQNKGTCIQVYDQAGAVSYLSIKGGALSVGSVSCK